jgi:hypothetical protein
MTDVLLIIGHLSSIFALKPNILNLEKNAGVNVLATVIAGQACGIV